MTTLASPFTLWEEKRNGFQICQSIVRQLNHLTIFFLIEIKSLFQIGSSFDSQNVAIYMALEASQKNISPQIVVIHLFSKTKTIAKSKNLRSGSYVDVNNCRKLIKKLILRVVTMNVMNSQTCRSFKSVQTVILVILRQYNHEINSCFQTAKKTGGSGIRNSSG